MANKLYEESHVQGIANNIRDMNLGSDTYKISEMPTAMQSNVEEKDYQSKLMNHIITELQNKTSGGITPTGTIDISENDTYDVTEYASVVVDVPSSGGGTGTFTLDYGWGQGASTFCYVNSDGIVDILGEQVGRTVINDIKVGSCFFVVFQQSVSIASKTFVNCKMSSPLAPSAYLIYVYDTPASLVISTSCFLPDTEITLADGTRKAIKDITYDDSLLVWDFDEGKYGTSDICWLTREGLHNGHYYRLTFSDGTTLCTTGQNSNHKIYNVDDQFFEGVAYIEMGKRVFTENGIVTVVNREYIEEEVEYYNLMTTGKINCFANGVLTSDRYGNLYPIDNMRYVKGDRPIRPYSEFEAVGIKKYWYDNIRLGESDETIEKAIDYVDKCESQMRDINLVTEWGQ